MERLFFLGLVGLLGTCTAWGAIPRSPISRDKAAFVRDGIFEGGRETAAASLDRLRLGRHQGFERLVWDFSDPTGKIASAAPRFQLRYDPGETFLTEQGETKYRRQPRFLLQFSALAQVHVEREELDQLARSSTLIREIQLYPPIEKGDRTMELILSRDVTFSPHQPIERAGRLVLDLRPR